jgi:uncharacterized protein (UPF0333 family)
MDKKGYSEIFSFLFVVLLVLVVAFTFYVLTKDLEKQVE